MKKLDTLGSIKESIEKIGQQTPIIKDVLGLTIDGTKRSMTGLKLKEVVLGNIISIEQHEEFVNAHNPPPMTTAEKKEYAKVLYKMYDDAKVPDMTIYRLIGRKLRCSVSGARKLLRVESIVTSDNVKHTGMRYGVSHPKEPVKHDDSNQKVMSKTELIDYLLNWLDQEATPTINENEKSRLLALMDLLVKRFGSPTEEYVEG